MTRQPSYERRIELALQDAGAPLQVNSHHNDDVRVLPHDALMPPQSAVYTRRPGDVVFDDMDELPQVLGALQDMTSITVDQATVQFVQRHETQHAWASRILKSPRSVFGVNLMPSNRPGAFAIRYYFHVALDYQTDKLGSALIFGLPWEGLEQDIKDIGNLGFTGGIRQIGDFALAENTRLGEYKYPVPLSYSRGGFMGWGLEDFFDFKRD